MAKKFKESVFIKNDQRWDRVLSYIRFSSLIPFGVFVATFFFLHRAGFLSIPPEIQVIISDYVWYVGPRLLDKLILPTIFSIITYIIYIIKYQTLNPRFLFGNISYKCKKCYPIDNQCGITFSEKDFEEKSEATPLTADLQNIADEIRKIRVKKHIRNSVIKISVRSFYAFVIPIGFALLMFGYSLVNPLLWFMVMHGIVLISFSFFQWWMYDLALFRKKTFDHMHMMSEKLINANVQCCGYVGSPSEIIKWLNTWWFDVHPDKFSTNGCGFCFKDRGYSAMIYVTMKNTNRMYYLFYAAVVPGYSYFGYSGEGPISVTRNTRYALDSNYLRVNDHPTAIRIRFGSPGIMVEFNDFLSNAEVIQSIVEEVYLIAEDLKSKKIVV